MVVKPMKIPISVLDLIPLAQGSTSRTALRNSIALAQHAEELGFKRYWFAEHHNMSTVVSTTPEIMIALAAEATSRIHVGSGGVMLPNHTPLKVAESFKILESLHPGRIDLGIGRAPGTDPAAALALRGNGSALHADDFPDRLVELMKFGAIGTPVGGVSAVPPDVTLPPIWLLGSGHFSARLAALLGIGFAFAAHFSDLAPEGPMLGYRELFRPAEGGIGRPNALLTISVVCADTDAEAEFLASSLIVSFVRLRTGQSPMLLSPEDATAYRFSQGEQEVANVLRGLHIVGSPETVKSRLDDLVRRTAADELMVTTYTYSHEARLHSYRLLAQAFGLRE